MQHHQNGMESIRDIVKQIHKKRKKVGGGTGKKERYEMRDTTLYYKLGNTIVDIAQKEGCQGETKQNFIGKVGQLLQKEFDDNENIAKLSVRLFEAYADEEQFRKVSKLCRNSLGQLREIIDILHQTNPFEIPSSEIENFKKQYELLETYDERRKLCTEIKRKYSLGGADVDLDELRESFDATERTVRAVLDGTEQDREKLRNAFGTQPIQDIRYMCMLLSREETFASEKSRKIIKKLIKSKPSTSTNSEETTKLYLNLKKFLILNSQSRQGLRNILSPHSMILLQKMLLAIQSEDDYENYKKTGELFRSIGI